MYTKNRSRRTMEPCGTPYKTESRLNSRPLTETYCFLLEK